MTITPEERAELRRLHEVYAGANILHNEHPLRRTFEKIFTGQFGNILDALEAAERERDRLREQGGELFLSGQVAKLREERDAAIAKCEQLAAYDAAAQHPTDADVEAWREEAMRGGPIPGGYVLALGEIEEAVRLMRRARPDAGLLRAAKELLKDTHPSNRDNFIVSNYVVDDLRAEVARVEGK